MCYQSSEAIKATVRWRWLCILMTVKFIDHVQSWHQLLSVSLRNERLVRKNTTIMLACNNARNIVLVATFHRVTYHSLNIRYIQIWLIYKRLHCWVLHIYTLRGDILDLILGYIDVCNIRLVIETLWWGSHTARWATLLRFFVNNLRLYLILPEVS